MPALFGLTLTEAAVTGAEEAAREIVDCGLWYLAEYENGEYTINHNPDKFTSVSDYLKKQGRFRHLTDEDIAVIEKSRDEKWKKIRKHWTDV